MRTMLAASLILLCTCAHALDDTPTSNVVMGPRGEDLRAPAPARPRQDAPTAHRTQESGDEVRRGVRPAPAATPTPAATPAPAVPAPAAAGRQGVQPWLAIRQAMPTGAAAQR
ncbi:hypothetical protein [Rugamonas apoptosis]|uniref:Uncharacterized protein n=1 Tax=Rugamonas apoptosis TaxID=2758570 RepID=A0A7W2FFA2_9BURK|nr:hypothetical protein [Rugamonas apoptosis]MBA5690638.1 hypothetical protein [Rugamonas apoptosis]